MDRSFLKEKSNPDIANTFPLLALKYLAMVVLEVCPINPCQKS